MRTGSFITLLLCVGAATTLLSAHYTEGAISSLSGNRRLLDVNLEHFDTLVSLKRLDGSNIQPVALNDALRDNYNERYFVDQTEAPAPVPSTDAVTTDPVVSAESLPRPADSQDSIASIEPASASQHPADTVDNLPRPDVNGDSIAHIENPEPAHRQLAQGGTAAAATAKPAAGSATAGKTSASNVRPEGSFIADMSNSQLQNTLLATKTTPGSGAKIEDNLKNQQGGSTAVPTFDGSGKLVSGGRRLQQGKTAAQAAPNTKVAGGANPAAAGASATPVTTTSKMAQPISQTGKVEGGSLIADMSNSQLQKTLLAAKTTPGSAGKIEDNLKDQQGGSATVPTFDGSGKLVSGGRKF